MAVVSLSGRASAHAAAASGGVAPEWTLDPAILLPLAASAVLFALGWLRLRARSRLGRPRLVRRGLLFGLGWCALVGALVSPLHGAGERSFTAHMVEHELMMLLAAPLLVMAQPLAVMLWAFDARTRGRFGRASQWPPWAKAWRVVTDPVTATLAQACVLWLWHMPSLFDRALASDAWHILQHLCFLVTALLFWSAMLDGRRATAAPMIAALCLFATAVVSGALGAFMAFSGSPWYAGYARLGMAPFGLTPTEDQELAGLLMWIPGGLVHAGAALALVAAALRPPTPAERAHAL